MKQQRRWMAVVLGSLVIGLSQGQTQAAPAPGAYKNALRRAGTEGKPVMIDFYTTWCGPCKALDKTIAKIPATMAKFVYLRVDAEKNVALAKQFKVNAYPTVVILKPDETIVHRWSGGYSVAGLTAVLEGALKKAGKIEPVKPSPKTAASTPDEARAEAQEAAAAADLRMAESSQKMGRTDDAAKAMQRIIERYPDTEAAAEAEAKLGQLRVKSGNR